MPLKIYEIQCTGIPVGYLTINEETEWGRLALKKLIIWVD